MVGQKSSVLTHVQWKMIATCVEWRFAGDSEHMRNLPDYYSKQNVGSYMLDKNCRNWTKVCVVSTNQSIRFIADKFHPDKSSKKTVI